MKKVVNNINRKGETNLSTKGQLMTIIDYKNKKNITIEFEDGTILYNKQYGNFKLGDIKNPMKPFIENIGFVGIGKYKPTINNEVTNEYKSWESLIKRCYRKQVLQEKQTYKDCTVCKEWHNFQNFAKWYEENKWDEIAKMVDKDILIKSNKLYSTNTCILVDNRINCLFTKRQNCRGQYLIGVYKKKNKSSFTTSCQMNGTQKYIGSFTTEIEAFQAYKQFKESYIKQVVDEYKEKYPNFPQKLYDAMYKYEVEIDD